MNTHRLNSSEKNHSSIFKFFVFVIAVMFLSACATIGKDFPVTEVNNIHVGKTTQKDLREMFGSPWRTGVEDAQQTWTYGNYNYGLFSEEKAKDLVIKFDNKKVVVSYTFSTTEHSE